MIMEEFFKIMCFYVGFFFILFLITAFIIYLFFSISYILFNCKDFRKYMKNKEEVDRWLEFNE